MQLSSDQRAAYARDGFLQLPGLLSAAEVALLRGEIERVAQIKAEEVKRESEDGAPKIMLGLHQEGRAVSSRPMASLVSLPRTLGVAQQALGDDALYMHHT